MVHFSTALILLASILGYFRVADRYNIIDKPNSRSSHSYIVIRGGGIIFWVAALIYLVLHPTTNAALFFVAITMAAAISFWDDIRSTDARLRLFVHLAAMSVVFYFTGVFGMVPWWAVLAAYIIFTGIVNAWNFMDGINGITGLYTLSVLIPLYYLNSGETPFADPALIWLPGVAALVFLWFNFRKRARCFAGDVGSVTVAFWMVTLLLMLIMKTGTLVWIGFLMLYGVDTIATILHRLWLKQNIFEAHRLHFYQVLANEGNMDHRLVSVIHFIVQLICSGAIIVFYPLIGWWIIAIELVILVAIYSTKFSLMHPEAK